MSRAAASIDLDAASKRYVENVLRRIRPEETFKAVDILFRQLAPRAANFIRKTQLNNQNLRRRSGNLFRSLRGFPLRHRGIPAIRVGVIGAPALSYGGVQEYGTKRYNPQSPYDTIRPRRGRALAMPVGHALTARGEPKYPGGARRYPRKLRFRPTRGGNVIGVLYDESLKAKGTVPFAPEALSGRLRDARVVYLLLKKVDLKPHWYLLRGMTAFVPEILRAVAITLGQRFGRFDAGDDTAGNRGETT